MPHTLKGVIFDYGTLLTTTNDPQLVGEQRDLLTKLKARGLAVVVFTTHPKDINGLLRGRNLPQADLVLTRADIPGKPNKGSPSWIEEAGRRLKLEPNDFLYVGDDKLDWRTAINSATLFIHALWSAPLPETATFLAQRPGHVWRFITHFLLTPPRWEYSLDLDEYNLHVRSLLNAGDVTLPSTRPSSFTLKDVLYSKKKVTVGPNNARDLLMIHAITSLYLEGLIKPNTFFATYPSSTPGKANPTLEEFVIPVSKAFHGYFKDDLLVRAVKAIDTSEARGVRGMKISIKVQTDSVCLNPKYEESIKGRSVIVVDDFTTSGMSLDWARNLLDAAGANPVILLTVGKFTKRHEHSLYVPKPGHLIYPYEIKNYDPDGDFNMQKVPMQHEPGVRGIIKESFSKLKDGLPL